MIVGITFSKFNNFLGKIEKAYNRKYPENQVPLFYEKLKHFPEEVFNKAVDDLCIRYKTLPGFPEIEEKLTIVFRSLRKDPSQEPLRIAEKPICVECYDRGLVDAKRKNGSPGAASYLFKCFCKAGQERPEDYPLWVKGSFEFTKLDYHDVEVKRVRAELKAKGLTGEYLFRKLHSQVLLDSEQEKELRRKLAIASHGHKKPIALVKAISEMEDISKIPMGFFVETARDLALFQECLIKGARGADQFPAHENETLIESLISFCEKFKVKHNFQAARVNHEKQTVG